jgi:two-component system LytT family sensor kinase
MKKKLSLLAILLQAFYLLLVTTPALVSIVYLVFHPWLFSHPSLPFTRALKFNLVFEALLISHFYVFYLVLFPRFVKTQRLKLFVFFGLLVTLVCIGLGGIVTKYLPFGNTTFGVQFADISIAIILNCLYPCGIAGIISWLSERHQRQAMEKINLETSLALLKAQINPHFLFNTLNNIDVLIEKDAAVASVYLKKLSDILRFTLYESPSDTVALNEEIKYIYEYIELQKIRTSNTDFVSFTVEGDTSNLQIAPMLFIPFIENAFKHATNKKINNAIEVRIIIKDGNTINFYCSNAFDADDTLLQPHSGLGLELIKSRLNLLYPNKYEMDIDKSDTRFTVTLNVNLHDN